jgi:hypothetical protein
VTDLNLDIARDIENPDMYLRDSSAKIDKIRAIAAPEPLAD